MSKYKCQLSVYKIETIDYFVCHINTSNMLYFASSFHVIVMKKKNFNILITK